LACLLAPTVSIAETFEQQDSSRPARIAIIMDDLGYNIPLGRRALSLPGNISYAILPHTPGSVEFARTAHAKGRDVILHAPMQSRAAKSLGPGGLRVGMDKAEFQRVLLKNIDAIPHVRGVNNHMGSLLTEHKQSMQWVMEALNERGLFFIDSRTSSRSIARKTAFRSTTPSLARDVFLDHHNTPEAIAKAFGQLIAVAKIHGFAIGICHPYANTLNFLEKHLPLLEHSGIELVSASTMIEGPADTERVEHIAANTSDESDVTVPVSHAN